MELNLRSDNKGISFAVKVVPRSPRNSITEVREGAVVVRLSAPPVEGKANVALISFLAEFFGLRKGQICLKIGEKSRHKVVTIKNIEAKYIEDKIARAISE